MRTALLAAAAMFTVASAAAFAQTDTSTSSGQTQRGTDGSHTVVLPNAQPAMPNTTPQDSQTTGQLQRGQTGDQTGGQTGDQTAVTPAAEPGAEGSAQPMDQNAGQMPASGHSESMNPPQTGAQPGAAPMQSTRATPGHEPRSAAAANIGPADTHSEIAPRLPVPPVGPDASAQELLQAAHMALMHKRSGEAQEALERAETRLLDRSTMPDAAGTPDAKPAIKMIRQAREALGRRDWNAANQSIDDAMKAPLVMHDGNGRT